MALAIYRETTTGVYAPILEKGSLDPYLPIITTHDGVLGEVCEVRLFVRNDDPAVYYTDISVIPVCTTTPSEVDGVSSGWSAKLILGSIQPTEAEWEATDHGNQIFLGDIGSSGSGDTSTYSPFWYRISAPAGARASNRENIYLRLFSTANAV